MFTQPAKSNGDSLAIIIPAYKARFLRRALESVARQSFENTQLYIFDDCSPEPVEVTAREALKGCQIPWSYERFDRNLGGASLIEHYHRCIRKTEEQWVWLFSDDDLMEPECVSSFWQTVCKTQGQFDVYCFDTVDVDSEDRIQSIHPTLADWESWKQFSYFLFSNCRFVPQQGIIFSRAAFEKLGGFVSFPLAWASDFATLMALAGDKGIMRIPGPKVRFRTSGENISSSDSPGRAAQKLQAVMQFIRWFFQQLEKVPDPGFPVSDDQLRHLAIGWFKRQLIALHTWYSPKECQETARFLSEICGESYPKAMARMIKLNLGMAGYSLRLGARSLSHPRKSAVPNQEKSKASAAL